MKEKIVVDTSGFFASAAKLGALLDGGGTLSAPDLVVFEFTRTIREEIERARGSGNLRRAEVMEALEERFPGLLRSLEIEVWTSGFAIDDVDELYRLLSEGHEPGDAMIWIKMKKVGLDTVATADASDWEALGARVVPLG